MVVSWDRLWILCIRRYTLSTNQGKFKCSTFFIRGNWYPSVVVDRGDILIFNTNYNTKMLSRDTIILKGILKNFDEIVEKINVSLITAKWSSYRSAFCWLKLNSFKGFWYLILFVNLCINTKRNKLWLKREACPKE